MPRRRRRSRDNRYSRNNRNYYSNNTQPGRLYTEFILDSLDEPLKISRIDIRFTPPLTKFDIIHDVRREYEENVVPLLPSSDLYEYSLDFLGDDIEFDPPSNNFNDEFVGYVTVHIHARPRPLLINTANYVLTGRTRNVPENNRLTEPPNSPISVRSNNSGFRGGKKSYKKVRKTRRRSLKNSCH